MVTDRTALFSACPIWNDTNLKESSEHLVYLVESSLLSSPPPPPHPHQGQASLFSSAGGLISENYNNQQWTCVVLCAALLLNSVSEQLIKTPSFLSNINAYNI